MPARQHNPSQAAQAEADALKAFWTDSRKAELKDIAEKLQVEQPQLSPQVAYGQAMKVLWTAEAKAEVRKLFGITEKPKTEAEVQTETTPAQPE
jgi:hypothetical protein